MLLWGVLVARGRCVSLAWMGDDRKALGDGRNWRIREDRWKGFFAAILARRCRVMLCF